MYTPSGSATPFTSDVVNCLNTYGYGDAHYFNVDWNYNGYLDYLDDSKTLIMRADAEGHTIFYGHYWVIDGYCTSTITYHMESFDGVCGPQASRSYYMVHCNWGWNGFCDGYYLFGWFDLLNGMNLNIYGILEEMCDEESLRYCLNNKLIVY